MSGRNEPISPDEALVNLFDLIRKEAASNPAFGRRLLEAVGHTVLYRGDQAERAVDPVLVAFQGYEEFRRTFDSMTVQQVKKVGLDSELLVRSERTLPRAKLALIDLLWTRCRARIDDVVPLRPAAE